MPKPRTPSRSLSAQIALLIARLHDLSVLDVAGRGALAEWVDAAAKRIGERDARARVSMRLVQEALRPDRDKGPRQHALHAAAAGLLEAVQRFCASRRKQDRTSQLELAERQVLAILRDMEVSSPTLTPRASDHAPEATPLRRSTDVPPIAPASGSAPATGAAPTSGATDDADRGFLREFVQEAREYIEQAEMALLTLERDPADRDAARTVMRALHSIKGTAGFLRLTSIVDLTHHGESLINDVLARGALVTGDTAALAIRVLDMLAKLVTNAEAMLRGVRADPPPRLAELLHELQRSTGEAERGTALVAHTPAPDSALSANASPSADDPTTRVQTGRLDRLVDMAGELVIAHWMIAQDPAVAASGHSALSKKVAHAGKMVRELHEMSMALRMVPLRSTCRRLMRLARDVAQQTGKMVRVEVEGDGTELDRNMVEQLADPLMHMVRNAIDHGIESPADRVASGKPETGVLRVHAYHASGQVVVELSDDGRGVQRAAVRERATALGLIDPGEQLTDPELLELIFAPGMSTARTVTEVSGRGVGMDVVLRNVQALRGRVDVHTAVGTGTTFTVRVPLTLAITDGMVVRVAGERFIVPTTNIVLSFRPERSALFTVAGRGEVARLRDEVLPIIRLHEVLDVEGGERDPTSALLMVVGAGERRAALLVDGILGQQQVVAKSVERGIGAVPGIAGAAILGDGRVGLILDVAHLVRPGRRMPGELRSQAVA